MQLIPKEKKLHSGELLKGTDADLQLSALFPSPSGRTASREGRGVPTKIYLRLEKLKGGNGRLGIFLVAGKLLQNFGTPGKVPSAAKRAKSFITNYITMRINIRRRLRNFASNITEKCNATHSPFDLCVFTRKSARKNSQIELHLHFRR